MLDLQPTLTGTHITLRPLNAADFRDLFAAASDPRIWAQHPDPDRGTSEGFPTFFSDALTSQTCLIAVDSEQRTVIGSSRYSNYAPGAGIEIGYTFLARKYWGGPTNAEMKRLMLHHAFAEVPEVRFTVAERNLRSRTAVEKLGAELVGIQHVPRWGQLHVIYRLTPELWERKAFPGYGPQELRASAHGQASPSTSKLREELG